MEKDLMCNTSSHMDTTTKLLKPEQNNNYSEYLRASWCDIAVEPDLAGESACSGTAAGLPPL
jgi:hypothetical protein